MAEPRGITQAELQELVGTGETPVAEAWRRLRRHKTAMLGGSFLLLLVLAAIFAPYLAPYAPDTPDFASVRQPPSAEHWMGTDALGRDVFSRILWGARISLRVGVIAVGIAVVVGSLLGALAGYYRRWVDEVIMRVMDVMLAFPSILLALALMMMLGRGIDKAMIAIGIVAIPQYARIVRGSILSVREMDFVEAARALGMPTWRILLRHIFPNVLSPVIVRATLGIAEAILEAAALGFLGLGAQAPEPEWGAMLAKGRQWLYTAPHIVIFPGAMITLTVLAFNLLGDGLRDALDPRLRQ